MIPMNLCHRNYMAQSLPHMFSCHLTVRQYGKGYAAIVVMFRPRNVYVSSLNTMSRSQYCAQETTALCAFCRLRWYV